MTHSGSNATIPVVVPSGARAASSSQGRLARKGQGGLSKKKSTSACVLASVLAGLVFAGPASAHTLDLGRAERMAEAYARLKVNDPTAAYTYSRVKCKRIRNYPHQFACNLHYHTAETRLTQTWACIETVVFYYKAHRNFGNHKVYRGQTQGHEC
jgi:hypothetical protein